MTVHKITKNLVFTNAETRHTIKICTKESKTYEFVDFNAAQKQYNNGVPTCKTTMRFC